MSLTGATSLADSFKIFLAILEVWNLAYSIRAVLGRRDIEKKENKIREESVTRMSNYCEKVQTLPDRTGRGTRGKSETYFDNGEGSILARRKWPHNITCIRKVIERKCVEKKEDEIRKRGLEK